MRGKKVFLQPPPLQNSLRGQQGSWDLPEDPDCSLT